MTKYNYILWDWNGTLLDDLDLSIRCINFSLEKRKLSLMTKEKYYQDFCFPVINYYKKIGFDFSNESYETVAEEFINCYNENVKFCELQNFAKKVTGKFTAKGIPQYILSASEKAILITGLKRTGIFPLFKDIIASDNIFANGKVNIASEYFARHQMEGKGLLIGDTPHDLEVAKSINADCILYSKGHSKKDNLLKLGVPVINELDEVYNYVFDDAQNYNTNINNNTSSFVENYLKFYDDIKPFKIDSKSDW